MTSENQVNSNLIKKRRISGGKMETCVLIPQELALAVTASGGRASKEPNVSVWSTLRIPQGSLCYPFQGTIRIDKLDVYSQLDESDVSVTFLIIACL